MRSSILLLIASLAALNGACVVHDDAAPAAPHDSGTLTVDWTIDDAKSGNACDANGASSIQITVFDSGGANVGTYEQTCAAFATSIPLAPGNYTANAVLVDSSDHPRTTTIAINPFTIDGPGDLDTPIDFPQSSFL